MSTNFLKIHSYASASSWQTLPESIHGFSQLTDDKNQLLLSLAFSTHRDLITAIGYLAAPQCPTELLACTSVLCQLSLKQPVLSAQLLGPTSIAVLLSDDSVLDDSTYYFAVLATLSLKNAISSYAQYRKADYHAWKSGQISP